MLERKEILTRPQRLAIYIIENKATTRQTAEAFKISKSTVHKDVTKNLFESHQRIVNGIDLYEEVRKVLDYNTSQKAIRGGLARVKKYKK